MITQTHRPVRTHPKTPPKRAGPSEKHCELAGRRGHPRKGRREQRTYTHREALDRDITGAANKIIPCFVARSVRSNSKLTKRARALKYSGQMPPTKSIRCRLRGQRCKCIHDHTCIGRLSVCLLTDSSGYAKSYVYFKKEYTFKTSRRKSGTSWSPGWFSIRT